MAIQRWGSTAAPPVPAPGPCQGPGSPMLRLFKANPAAPAKAESFAGNPEPRKASYVKR